MNGQKRKLKKRE